MCIKCVDIKYIFLARFPRTPFLCHSHTSVTDAQLGAPASPCHLFSSFLPPSPAACTRYIQIMSWLLFGKERTVFIQYIRDESFPNSSVCWLDDLGQDIFPLRLSFSFLSLNLMKEGILMQEGIGF